MRPSYLFEAQPLYPFPDSSPTDTSLAPLFGPRRADQKVSCIAVNLDIVADSPKDRPWKLRTLVIGQLAQIIAFRLEPVLTSRQPATRSIGIFTLLFDPTRLDNGMSALIGHLRTVCEP